MARQQELPLQGSYHSSRCGGEKAWLRPWPWCPWGTPEAGQSLKSISCFSKVQRRCSREAWGLQGSSWRKSWPTGSGMEQVCHLLTPTSACAGDLRGTAGLQVTRCLLQVQGRSVHRQSWPGEVMPSPWLILPVAGREMGGDSCRCFYHPWILQPLFKQKFCQCLVLGLTSRRSQFSEFSAYTFVPHLQKNRFYYDCKLSARCLW